MTVTDRRLTPGRPSPQTATRPLSTHDPVVDQARGKPVAFDLETRGSEHLWTDLIGTHTKLGSYIVPHQDVRLAIGHDLQVGPDHTLLDILAVAGWLTGHNIMNYDLPVLHRHHGFPTPWQLLEQGIELHDTQLVESLLDPAPARMKEGEAAKYFKLDAVVQRLGFSSGKTLDLSKVAKHYDGFENIPWDDPLRNIDLLAYARQDTALVKDLFLNQRKRLSNVQDHDQVRWPYIWREHKVAAIASQIMINGFRIDVPLLEKRVTQGQDQRHRLLEDLHENYGLPRETKDGKPAKSPQATAAGKEAIFDAFVDAGLNGATFPRKKTSKSPDLSQETMKAVIDSEMNDRAVALAELVMELNGVRSVYQTIYDYLAGDRVHPNIQMRQASGRWSTTKPGLTVVGKRGKRITERDVFLADEGHVLIAVDLAQIDARVVAVNSQDPAYIAMFEQGKDLHTWVAEKLWHDPKRRQDAKVLAHGWAYSMGLAKLAASAGISMREAERYDSAMRQLFPKLVKWRKEIIHRGGTEHILDNGWGRKMAVDPERAYTQAPALTGQGGARDCMMEGLLRVAKAIPESLNWFRLQVHDEVIMSVPEQEAANIEQDVAKAMSYEWCPPGKSIPIQVVAEPGKARGRRWSECYGKG